VIEPVGRYIHGGDGSHWEGCDESHWDCRIAKLEAAISAFVEASNWRQYLDSKGYIAGLRPEEMTALNTMRALEAANG